MLRTGKVPTPILKEIIFKRLGAKRSEVILGPSPGEDGALIEVGDKVLVSSVDPITGAYERIGLLAVNISANDVATFGVQPAFFSSCILLPERSVDTILRDICDQIHKAARELGVAVIGGHCEVTPDLNHPIVFGCSIGVTEKGRYVTSKGAKPGDSLILTKGAGIEGTAILATDRRNILEKEFDDNFLKRAEDFFNFISVVKEASLAFETELVTSMHDPTEGGVVGGIHELADASNVGVNVFENEITVAPETRRICDYFEIDPLQLISSGSLLISARSDSADKIVSTLNAHEINSSIIGEFLPCPKSRTLKREDGSTVELKRPTSDHLWIALEK